MRMSNRLYWRYRNLQKEQNRCRICNIIPNWTVTKRLGMNDNCLIQVQRQWYTLCWMCENYYHLNCYAHKMQFSREEKLEFKNELENGAHFFCYRCRTESEETGRRESVERNDQKYLPPEGDLKLLYQDPFLSTGCL